MESVESGEGIMMKYTSRNIVQVGLALAKGGAAVAEWLSSWLAEQEDRGSTPILATSIFRDWLSPASKSRYGWKIAKSTLILKTTNQPTLAKGVFNQKQC